MGVLDFALALKKQRREQELADIEAIPRAVDSFLKAKETRDDNFLKQLQVADTISKIQARQSEAQFSVLDRLTGIASKAKDIGNRDLFNAATSALDDFTGAERGASSTTKQITSTPQSLPRESKQVTVNDIVAPERDNFTGELTEKGEEDKARNDLIISKLKENQANLSGESAVRFAGAVQGLKDVQEIIDLLKFTKDSSGKVNVRSDIRSVLVGQKAAAFQARPFGFSLPLVSPLVAGSVQAFAGSDARKLQLKLETLAENVLRARTGAAAPEPEIIRETARSFLRLLDSPDIMLERLMENEFFLKTTANSIKSGSFEGVQVPSAGGLDSDAVNRVIEEFTNGQ